MVLSLTRPTAYALTSWTQFDAEGVGGHCGTAATES